MNITITTLLYNEIIWNKELVIIEYNGINSELKRLEFQYDAIDNNYEVVSIEPFYSKELDKPYLLIECR